MERFVVGKSEAVEAEYAHCADAPVTVLQFTDGEIVSIEGFASIKAARANLKEGGVSKNMVHFL